MTRSWSKDWTICNVAEGFQSETVESGVTIDALPESAVNRLAGHEHKVQGLAGVSVASTSSYRGDVLMDALTQHSFAEMMPDVYLTYERVFETGQGCIVTRDCLWAEGSVYSIADWGLLGEVEAERRIEFRWVETAEGGYFSSWWLLEPSTGSMLTCLSGSVHIGVIFPWRGDPSCACELAHVDVDRRYIRRGGQPTDRHWLHDWKRLMRDCRKR